MAQDFASLAKPALTPTAPVNSNLDVTQALGSAFSSQQKEYLDGFLRAIAGLPQATQMATAPEPAPAAVQTTPYGKAESTGYQAQMAWLNAGKRLSKEEQIKFESHPLESWDSLVQHSALSKFPEGADIFRFKFHGLFNVATAQEGMMCRLRIPGGAMSSEQMRRIADCAERYGGGYVDITTRANLQIREIPAQHMENLLIDLHQAGIVPRGSGADNIRNVTGNPTAGLDPQELIDVLPLCRQLHHTILHRRELYGLPRKFNIAFDGGNSIGSLEDTNDIGFRALSVSAESGVESGIYFRCLLGGITGHQDLARDTGLLLKPQETIPVAIAMVQVFIQHGDRGNRKKARLKYVLDAKGFSWFLEETQKLLPFPLRKLDPAQPHPRPKENRAAHLGVHPQKQTGLYWVGVNIPVGRLQVAQLRGLAKLSMQYGSGDIRLTVWQNLLLTGIPEDQLHLVFEGLQKLGLDHHFDPISAGTVACTGSEGCKFGQAPTKATARSVIEKLGGRYHFDDPINIHLTGCQHSCAQHFIGDIGLIATRLDSESGPQSGFHIFVGGGWKEAARIGIPIAQSVPTDTIPAFIDQMVQCFLSARTGSESFSDFTSRLDDDSLQKLFGGINVVELPKVAA